MTITVTFDHNWNEQDLEKWNEDYEGTQFDDCDRETLMEISLLAELVRLHPDAPLSVLETAAKTEIQSAIEGHLDEILEGWISYAEMHRSIVRKTQNE